MLKKLWHGNLKGLLTEKTAAPTTVKDSLSLTVNQYGDSNFCLIFTGNWQNKKAIFNPLGVIKVFNVYELDRWLQNLNANFTLNNCLFGSVKLTKNVKVLIQINFPILDSVLARF